MKNAIHLLTAVMFLTAGCSDNHRQARRPILLQELEIIVRDSSRGVAFTNKNGGVFYTESNATHSDSWQGWRVMSSEILEDYRIRLDGQEMNRSTITESRVFPHQMVRTYSTGVTETITLLDSIDAIVVELLHVDARSVSLAPLFQNAKSISEFRISRSSGTASIARARHASRTEAENYPVWICLGSDGIEPRCVDTASAEGISFSPCALEARPVDGRISFVFVGGDSAPLLHQYVPDLLKRYPSLIGERGARMEGLLRSSYFRSNSPDFDKSVQWALLSLDALIMNQVKKGIFAGLPWFDNYWGRDSFISLPGATLVSGHFAEARRMLRSFAEWQDTVPASLTYGRIPNLVTVHSIAFNTADGTPWFVIGLYDYFRNTNDSLFVREMYPVVRRSIEGTLRHHTDSLQFITHGDAETWMDAVGPDGPWSPRGNRACDLQALWHNQLTSAARMAECTGDTSNARAWMRFATDLEVNFNDRFISPSTSLLYDHLNPDGSADTMLRPNQLFALDLVRDPAIRSHILTTVTSELVYPHGVASLDQDDPAFHPYHHYQPYYVQDAAYHQGIVWTWLAGIWIERMNEMGLQDTAWRVTANLTHQILHRGTVGTLSELLDAAPRKGEDEPRLSGTYSQAWSLAEFLRVLFRSYLGITADLPSGTLTLSPRLPDSIHHVETTLNVGASQIPLTYDRKRDRFTVVLGPSDLSDSLTLRFVPPLSSGGIQPFEVRFSPARELLIDLQGSVARALCGNEQLAVITISGFVSPFAAIIKRPSLATPVVHGGLAALKGPSHRLLSHDEISTLPFNPTLLLDQADPSGDDIGNGKYTYPTTPYLIAGSLDLLGALVEYDSSKIHFSLKFTTLSNPGWHPEYGFQLTYAAVLIDKDGRPGTGTGTVGMNAGYRLPERYGYENAIFVGGGVRITDENNRILAEYLPQSGDSRKPFGDVASATVRFSVPVDILGRPSPEWRIYVLVGCQDDHGGAGIGEFRNVERIGGEWSGGGRLTSNDPNVYDFMLPR